ncbi:MAG TPA: right-handed parallel beta-helix repeat-containing protein [Thermoanaerobaculia bacterium]
MLPLRRVAVILGLFAGARAAAASVIYVDAASSGSTHDGASWASAFVDLQAALTAATATDEIWVAAGTYKPAATDPTASFALKNGVGIYGGFAGTETLRSQRDPAGHVTTLSGEIGAAGTGDNSYHVVTADGAVTSSAVLDGFTITAGHASGAATDQQRGGGMLVSGGSPTLSQLRFANNFASDRGGGVRVESGAPTFSVCAFTSNSSGTAGGGLSSASATSLSVKRCAFTGNATGPTRGAGIDANSVSASNCLVAGNSSNGISIAQDGASFVNCTITGNNGYGAIFVGGSNSSVINSILFGDALGEVSPFFFDAAISYSDVAGGHAGTGNIASSPVFENSGGSDYRLASGSPGVDAGSNAAAAALATDLAGLPRFFDDPAVVDTGSGTAPIVDMGASERVPLSVSSPAGQSVCAGAPVSFSVTASGQPTLSYRWRKGGSNLADGGAISGSGTDMLTLDPSGTGDSGSYDVAVTDAFGQTKTSSAATLTVNAVPAAPALTAPKSVAVNATGVSASVPDHAGSAYAWTLSGGSITSGQGTHQIGFSAGAPGIMMALSVVETGPGGCASLESAAKVLVDFADVPPSYLFHNAVVTVARDGVTTGCGGGKYCPDDPVTRDAMAVFILRGEHGATYNPPAATGDVFSDVTTGTFLAKWMEQFGREGISTGCGAGSPPPYCPTSPVTRDGMAVFLLRGKHGASFNPPAATGAVFCDVTAGTFLAKWMEELKAESITSGCGGGACGKPNYCAANTVTRGEMAAFIVKTFGLQ